MVDKVNNKFQTGNIFRLINFNSKTDSNFDERISMTENKIRNIKKLILNEKEIHYQNIRKLKIRRKLIEDEKLRTKIIKNNKSENIQKMYNDNYLVKNGSHTFRYKTRIKKDGNVSLIEMSRRENIKKSILLIEEGKLKKSNFNEYLNTLKRSVSNKIIKPFMNTIANTSLNATTSRINCNRSLSQMNNYLTTRSRDSTENENSKGIQDKKNSYFEKISSFNIDKNSN